MPADDDTLRGVGIRYVDPPELTGTTIHIGTVSTPDPPSSSDRILIDDIRDLTSDMAREVAMEAARTFSENMRDSMLRAIEDRQHAALDAAMDAAQRAADAAAALGREAAEEAAREAARTALENLRDQAAANEASRHPVGGNRQPQPPSTEQRPSSLANLPTSAEVARAARVVGLELVGSAATLRDGHPLKERAKELVDGLGRWLPHLERGGDRRLSPAEVAQVRRWEEDIAEVQRNIQREKAATAVAKFHRERDRISESAREQALRAKQLQERLTNAMRTAFRSGDKKFLEQVHEARETSKTLEHNLYRLSQAVLGLGLDVADIARVPAEKLAEFFDVELPAMSKYAEALDLVDKMLAGLDLAIIALDNQKAATELEQAMKDLSKAVGVFSALETLTGAAPHLGGYLTAISAGLERAAIQVSEIIDQAHDKNIALAEIGAPINWEVEPGGQPLKEFMDSVMTAKDESELPVLEQDLEEFLLDHRDMLEVGAPELPTRGFWRWTSIDHNRLPEWLHTNRTAIWEMLYGRMPAP